jgi:hypothetical protein
MVACDFLTVDTLSLRRLYVLFIHHQSRRGWPADVTAKPIRDWVTQQACNTSVAMREADVAVRFVVRPGVAGRGGQSRRTPYRTPVAKSIAER